jgi:hypothetical protein
VGDTQLLARINAAVLAAQPLPVEQVRPGELRTQPRTAQPIDRFAVQAVGGRAVAQQRPGARLDAEPEVGSGGLCRLRQPLEGIACELGLSSAHRRLDELRQCPHRVDQLEKGYEVACRAAHAASS